ncbi:lysoplasmalogenase family protein [Aquimarina addita]|uniref:lysoplasmalogenase family protein n=1 Tax=Aquimarina addita TaxID=870485 RepID=UPI0031F13664
MKVRTLIKFLLLLTGGLCVLSAILQNFNLEFYSKPMTVPLFFMLYWFNVKKIDFLFLAILFFCFLGDIFLLIQIERSFIFVLLSNIMCYLLIFVYLYRINKRLVLNKVDRVYYLIFLVFWSVVAYIIYSVTEVSMGDIRPYGILYIGVLYILLSGAVFQYTQVRSSNSLWLLIACLNFVVSDTCFALDRFYIPSLELKVINSIYQLLAVYFLVKFKISKADSLKLEES